MGKPNVPLLKNMDAQLLDHVWWRLVQDPRLPSGLPWLFDPFAFSRDVKMSSPSFHESYWLMDLQDFSSPR